MNAKQQMAQFEISFLWWARENRRLLAIIQTPGKRGKHRAWRKLMELALRKAQLQRELNLFLKHQTTGNA